MSPYVHFQGRLIEWLTGLQQNAPDLLESVISICRSEGVAFIDWPQLFKAFDFAYDHEQIQWHELSEYKLWEVILEQIDDAEDGIRIVGVFGMSLYRVPGDTVSSYESWRMLPHLERMLRTKEVCQVGALEKGDQLLGGEIILFPAREGGNGSVLICISNGEGRPGVWLDYPARTILPLQGLYPRP
jgi:hypothetical protein